MPYDGSASPLEQLAYHAQVGATGLRNALQTRHHHPSYGENKGKLRQAYQRVCTLVEAHMIAAGAWPHYGSPTRLDLVEYAPRMGVDLAGLEAYVKEEIGL